MRNFILGVLGVVLLVGGFLGGQYVTARNIPKVADIPIPVALPALPPAPTVKTISGLTVLRRVQELNDLASVSYKIQTVVTTEKAGTAWKLWFDGQKAIFVADGTVLAGIPLSKLTERDVKVSADGKSVRISLPPATIIHTGLDQTRTYDYETGAFGLINLDQTLMEQAQQDAKKQIRANACASGILNQATQNGERSVEGLLETLGFEEVNVDSSAVPQCVPEPIS